MKFSGVKGLVFGSTLGLALGVAGYTFIYAKGGSYMTNDPKACVNCHIMQEQYDAWVKSSHRSVAACNDCHAPKSLVPKYYTKARNGLFHSIAFTTGRHPDPIRINAFNRSVTEQACRRCHADIVEAIDRQHAPGKAMSCIECHHDVGHPNKL